MIAENAKTYDVVVVGGGAAGVGAAITLKDAGVENFVVLERHAVGSSFASWPAEMRFLTPSFATNAVGMLDINSVAIGTSAAFTLQVEHPSGGEYAVYLQALSQHFELPVRTGVDVMSITPADGGFLLNSREGQIRSRFVIWAAGEFQYPQTAPFPGAGCCRHNATVDTWESIDGREAVVIGGYESGIDAAIHLARLGKKVTVLDCGDPPPWEDGSSDPSISLSTFTTERLRDSEVAKRLDLVGGAEVVEVRRERNEYRVICTNGRDLSTKAPPILATGFRGSTSLVADLFERRDDRYPLLSALDESTITQGLFLCGPMVRHNNHVFCFIYKFRQRFAVVAKTIADRLGLPAEQLEEYRQWGMYLDDLSCCGKECVC